MKPSAVCAHAQPRWGNLGQHFLRVPARGHYCTAPCTSHAECGAGGVCVGAVEDPGTSTWGLGHCEMACPNGNSDCRSGYECLPPDPLFDIDGAFDESDLVPLEQGVNTCWPKRVQLADHVAGAACSVDADCGRGRCQISAPGGSCTSTCV